jgi:Nucleotidyltransferase of unknown function (DUF6036)
MRPKTISEAPAEPWRSFLSELDALLDRPGDFHCIGGFVISQYYGFARETADLDLLTVVPTEMAEIVASLAGEGSPLHKKYRVYVDHVGVASFPDNYETRLVRAFPAWSKARIWVLEAHDLALTKLERSNERDIRDVMFLAQAGLINRETLVDRFESEMRPYLVGRTATWDQTTLQMWIEACWPAPV